MMLKVQESSSVGSWFSCISFIVTKTSALVGYTDLSKLSEMLGIWSYSSSTNCGPPPLLYFISTLPNENNWITGQASTSIPIWPGETLELVFTDFDSRTTLFRFIEEVGDPVHALKEALPSVDPEIPPLRGIATPSVVEKLTPNTEGLVDLSQKTPKSRLWPWAPTPLSKTIWSAVFAASTCAKYAYHWPSEPWTIRSCLPFMVTFGSPFPWSVSRILLSIITTSTTIDPSK